MEIEMDPSTAQFHHQHQGVFQEMSSQTLESMLVCNKAAQEKKPRPPDQAALKCPRCDSTNTKFCYYNNYSLTQPRYFCKSCRRYWTKGGTLRNVPVGGGCRKSNKRPSSSSNSASPTSSSSSKRAHDLHHQPLITSSNTNPLLSSLTHLPYHHDSTTTDLSLAFARLQSQANAGQLGFDHDFLGNSQNTPHCHDHDHFLATNASTHHSFLDAIRGGFLETGTSNGFHNVYPFGDQLGNAENGGILGLSNVSEDQMGMNPYHHHDHHQEEHMASSGAATTAVTVTTVKQESCNAREVGESRVLWGFPWQIGGDQGNVVEVDSGRQIGNWNGFGSTWHGLLNSPLM